MMPITAEAETLFASALARYQAGDPHEAARLFAAVLEQVPDHPDALRLRGLALARSGQAAAALPLLARARRLAPRDPLVHLHYGIGLLEVGRPARAASLFRRATTMLPDDPVPWINFSAAILALGRPQAARAAARRALALAPQSPSAHYALGLAEQAARNLPGARAAFATATRLAPGFAEAWVNLGLACFQLGHIGDASQAMERALAVKPGFGAAEANLAGFILLQGDQDEALRRLRAVLARDPACVPARLNLANALLLDREAEEALALLEGPAPPGREGAHYRAHRAMALLLRGRNREAAAELDAIPQPYGDAELLVVWRRVVLAERARDETTALALADHLSGLVQQEGAALIEHRIISQFELATFRARRRERDRAFAHWQAGHALLARLQPFSRDAVRQFVDANIASFGAARLRDGPHARTRDDAPVFIVGLPRSGTSLTEQILAAHPMVHGAGERPALHRAVVKLSGPAFQPASVRRFAALDETALSGVSEQYLAELHALAPAARLVTDKMPGNSLYLGAVATLLPQARIIRCRRDPRDIGLSIFQFRFFGYHPYAHDLGDLGWFIAEHERLMAHWTKVLPAPPLEIELSDWVHDFDGTLRRLLDFVGLPYDPACERFYAQERRVRTASAEQVRQPVNARGLGRWRNYASQLAPMIEELQAAGLLANQGEP
jgi:tetratricopeptide (TPR) repeat protein